jgi:hypothetical protein
VVDLSRDRAGARRELVRLGTLAAERCAVPVLPDVGPWRARLRFRLDGELDPRPGLRPDLRLAVDPSDGDLALLGKACAAAGYTLAYRDRGQVRVTGYARPQVDDAPAVIRTFVETVLVPFHALCPFATAEIVWWGNAAAPRVGGHFLRPAPDPRTFPIVSWIVHRDGDADVTTRLDDHHPLGPCVLARSAAGFRLTGRAMVNGQRARDSHALLDHDVLEIDGVEYVYLSTQ